MKQYMKDEILQAEKVLIGIGSEWDLTKNPEKKLLEAYNELYELIKEKDYFVVTSLVDACIYKSKLDPGRITAPCGNVTWRQCSKSCTADIWEDGEVPDDICPHCGAPLTGNTIKAEKYIEEGYLPQWQKYTHWLTMTINKKLVILELGEGFQTPTVIRWPFEKTVMINQKCHMYRVHSSLSQLTEEIKERAKSVQENSIEWTLT